VTWKKALAGLAVVLLVMAIPVSGFANPRTYTITADAPGITGCALNNHGDFVGTGAGAGGKTVYGYINGNLQFRDAFAGSGTIYLRDYRGLGINDEDTIAGANYWGQLQVFYRAGNQPASDVYVYQNQGAMCGSVAGINNSGQVAGTSDINNFPQNGWGGAFLANPENTATFGGFHYSDYNTNWWDGTTRCIGAACTSTAINDAGDVVGYAQAGEYCRAFIYSNGSLRDMGIQEGPVGNITLAFDVNNSGVVVGESTIVGLTEFGWGFVWQDGGGYRGLGAGMMYAAANAINDSNEIVGASGLSSNFYQKHAYLWTDDIRPYDLNSLVNNLPTGFVLNEAVDINNNGQILCNGSYTSSGLECSFLLTPTGFFADVPEPSTASLLFGVALAALVLRLRRREQAGLSTL